MNLSVYGEIALDWFADYDSSVYYRWGGAGLYASIGAAKQGVNVDLLTLLGPELGKSSIALWKSFGISFQYADKIDSYSFPRYLITGYRNFEKKISRPMNEIKMDYNYIPEIPPNTNGILIFPIGHVIPLELCIKAVENKIPIFLDPKLNNESIKDARKALKYTSVLLANEEEIQLLAEEQTVDRAIQKLAFLGPQYIIIKKGIKGCTIVREGKDSIDISAFKSNAICTVGSGDVFGGAFAATFLETNDILYSVELASSVVANFVEHFEIGNCISKEIAIRDMKKRERLNVTAIDDIVIYLAGPFFSQQEVIWVNYIYNKLQSFGLKVLSPSLENGIINESTDEKQKKNIFINDIKLLEQANIVVALLDHNDPGTCYEIGYAYKKGIPVIGLKTDNSPINNMIVHSCDIICNTLDELIVEVCNNYGRQ